MTGGSARLPKDGFSFGEHEVVRVIARGGMGSVFEVRSRRTGVAYAAKTVLRTGDAKARDRFRREAELLARVDKHPGIVKVHAYGETADGTPYMILDLVRGEGLEKLLEREGPLAPRRAAEIARAVATALGFVHELGVVHRDLKPSNILLDADGTPRLTDFGLATARDVERLTRTGVFLGTFGYSAPEQATGAANASSPRADVFGLGAVLFHLLTGHTPVEAETPLEALAKLAGPEPIRDVRLLAPSVPGPLAAIVAHALAKDPLRRFPDGEAMAQDLALFLAGRPTSSSAAFEPPPLAHRRVRLAGLAAAAVVVVGAGAGLVAVVRRTGQTRAAAERSRTAAQEARAALARSAKAAGRSAEPLLAQALEQAQKAEAAALEAGNLGSPEAAVLTAEATLVLGEAGTAVAEHRLAAGQAKEALDVLSLPPDGAPRKDLPPAGHLARARALLALKHYPEAGHEASLVLEAGGSLRADAAEVLGDAQLAVDQAARAQASYAQALDWGPRRPGDVRIKRGSAAARAGDDKVALADLAAAIPDVGSLGADRESNARLAGLAPALYRRGLLAEGSLADRDLEAAWRLAPPPVDLAPRVARRWAEPALRDADAWAQRFVGEMRMDEGTVEKLRTVFHRLARARAADPACDVRRIWDTFALLRNWSRNTDAGIIDRVAQTLAAEWPDLSILDYMRAVARRRVPGQRHDALVYGLRSARELPPPEEGEHQDVKRLAAYIAVLLGEVWADDDARDETVALVHTLAERAPYSDGWVAVARLETSLHHADEALAAVDRMQGLNNVGDLPVHEDKILRERIIALGSLGRGPEAHAVLDALPKELALFQLRYRCLVWRGEKRFAEIVAAVDPATVTDEDTLLFAAEALGEVGRMEEARAIQARLERASSDLLAELRIYLDALQRRR